MQTVLDDQADQLRRKLVDALLSDGFITSPQVASAFLVVPRHVFAPEVPLEEAYRADDSIRINLM